MLLVFFTVVIHALWQDQTWNTEQQVTAWSGLQMEVAGSHHTVFKGYKCDWRDNLIREEWLPSREQQ